MAFSISYQFIAHDKFTRVASKMVGSLRAIDRQLKTTHQMSKKVAASFEHLRSLGAQAFVGLTLPLAGMTAYGFKAAATMEKLGVTISTATGSTERGTEMLQKFVDFAAKTPFQIEGVAETGKMLLGFGIEAKDVMGSMKMLGDIAAGTGRPIKDLAFVYGQVRAKQKLLNEEIMQFAERGLPLLEVLSKGTRMTVNDFQKAASEGKVSFEIFKKAMEQIHADKYMNNMDKISKTLGGLLSNIKDKIFIAASGIFTHMDKMFSIKDKMQQFIDFLDGATQMVNNFVNNNPKLARMSFIMLAVLAVIPPLMMAIGALGFVVSLVSTGIGLLSGAFSLLLSPIALGIAAFAALVYAGYQLVKNWDDIVAAARKWTNDLEIVLAEKFASMVDMLKSFGSLIYDAITSPFESAVKLISMSVQRIIKMKNDVVDAFTFIRENPQGLVGDMGKPGYGAQSMTTTNQFTYGMSPMTGADLATRSSVDINMVLNAPERTVKSVTQKKGGFGNASLGVSMEGQ